MDTNLVIAGLVVVLLLVVAYMLWSRNRRSDALERRFGPEYGRAVGEMGDRDKAEAELLARQKRVEQLHIVPLAPADAQRFHADWMAVQGRFVDDPRAALADADRLVRELMQRRGYPMGDFERRAADISVDHPHVVEHYRVAHEIAQRDPRGEVDTEGMRQALIHYRALFADLLEVADASAQQSSPVHPHAHARS